MDSSSSNDSVASNRKYLKGAKPQVQQLFARISQEIIEKEPANPVFFIVDFLCKHYPQHLNGYSAIWNADPELEKDRLQVVEFFRYVKLPTEIASHFTAAGFDTLETLCTLTTESLDDIERFNQTRWLPGHKVRMQQTFSDIASKIRMFRQEREKLMHVARIQNGTNVQHSCSAHGPAALPGPGVATIAHPSLSATTVGHVNVGLIDHRDLTKQQFRYV